MMKIISKKIDNKFVLELMDGKTVLDTKIASDITKRDSIITSWTDVYQVTDIQYTGVSKKKQKEKDEMVSDIPSLPYIDELQLEQYFDTNDISVFDRILSAIEDGINTKKKKIKLFELSKTGIFITSSKKDWIKGLNIAHEGYLRNQQFEKCTKCLELIEQLKLK